MTPNTSGFHSAFELSQCLFFQLSPFFFFFCGDTTVLKLDPQSGSRHENRYCCRYFGQRKCTILIGYTGDEKTGKPYRGWQGKPKISHNKKQQSLLQDSDAYNPIACLPSSLDIIRHLQWNSLKQSSYLSSHSSSRVPLLVRGTAIHLV